MARADSIEVKVNIRSMLRAIDERIRLGLSAYSTRALFKEIYRRIFGE